MEGVALVVVILGLLTVALFASAVRIVQEYERGVVFRIGRLVGARGPGLFLLIPILERMQKVDLRTLTMDVPAQECITRDNVTVKVNAVVFFRVVNPSDAITKVFDYIRATSQISQTSLRSVMGQSHLDELLANREQVNLKLQQIIDEETEPWGVKVSNVEVKDVELPTEMVRAIARQAEAERERRAKIIHAEGEFEASERLAEAGKILAAVPTTLQLRFLQTLTEIATEKNSTLVFPVPIDLISAFMNRIGGTAPATPPAPATPTPPPASAAPAPPAAPPSPPAAPEPIDTPPEPRVEL